MAECTKCNDGMITEVDGPEIFKWRCDCKTPEFWEHRQQQSKARRDAVLREYSQKVGV